MPDKTQSVQTEIDGAVRELAQLGQFAGTPKEFWPRYVGLLARLARADRVAVLVRNPAVSESWRRLLEVPPEIPPSKMLTAFSTRLDEVASQCARQGALVLPLDPKAAGAGHFVVALPLLLQAGQKEECVAAALISETTDPEAREALTRLRLAGNVPELYQAGLAVRQAKADVEKFASALDLGLVVGGHQKFVPAAMALCNSLATQYGCARVSLGLLEKGYVRLKAISRTEKFSRQMSAVQALESAMEEALDQDDEVVWPAPEGAAVISRDHEKFAKAHNVQFLCSVPLRAEGKPAGVVTLERQGKPFSALDVQQLRLCGDMVAPQVFGLRKHDKWFGARWVACWKAQAAALVGHEHTWAKLLGVVIAAALVVLFLVPVPYRVEGSFSLRSDELAHLTAPFEGYIAEALVRPGDRVAKGDKLVGLRTDELELEESAALADLNRYQREAEKARAAVNLAEMRVNEALAQQAAARLALVRHRITEASIKAPFDGVVVEGDLRDRLGAPVKTADVLMKVARIDTLYVEAEVNERDVHEVIGRSSGEIAFLSQPRRKFPIHITTLEQAAVPKAQANVFLVRCAVEGGAQPWWRPGMSGVCKLHAGKRTLFWIFTHRTVDFLRLKLWW